jgi:hypothetical protein
MVLVSRYGLDDRAIEVRSPACHITAQKLYSVGITVAMAMLLSDFELVG